ncbi:MAG: AAA family ATPase [Halioglobus sp.]
MKRLLIYGNSGTGKSTLAKKLAQENDLPLLDLDTLAWSEPGVRESEETSLAKLRSFCDANEFWIIEGCYGSMIKELAQFCTELHFLNPGIEASLENNAMRPWEPHKYESLSVQNQHFEKLQEWVKLYKDRDDEFSYRYHRSIFRKFSGTKYEHTSLGNHGAQ